jgi:hypothetical protein
MSSRLCAATPRNTYAARARRLVAFLSRHCETPFKHYIRPDLNAQQKYGYQCGDHYERDLHVRAEKWLEPSSPDAPDFRSLSRFPAGMPPRFGSLVPACRNDAGSPRRGGLRQDGHRPRSDQGEVRSEGRCRCRLPPKA